MAPVDFAALGLSPVTLRALEKIGFVEPTPVQAQAIPPALEGRDVIACAATGTGKTAAFALPMVERLAKTHGLTGVVLAPTRELALQIAKHTEPFAAAHGLTIVTLIGGVEIDEQLKAVGDANIVVATPGRLVDHLKRESVSLAHVKVFVLDEADRMLDMGFKPQLRRVLGRLPRVRQSMLFSATMGEEVTTFATTALRSPVRVDITPSGTTAQNAEQVAYEVPKHERNALLLALLARDPGTKTLVFCRTRRRAEKMIATLLHAGHRVVQLHAERSQAQRQHALEGFRTGRYLVLVTTDISTRGIDVANIAHVVNYDVPFVAEDYVHRIGRTARAQASGQASTFITPEDTAIVAEIERVIRAPIPRAEVPRDSEVFQRVLAEERARQADPGPQTPAAPRPADKPLGRHARSHPKKPKA